jgi:hypothetical protein
MKSLNWLWLLLFLGACSKPEKNYVLKVKLQNLTPETIYDKDLVYDVIFESQEQNVDSLKVLSRQLFLKGVDLYKNKKQPAKAVNLFVESILTFPEAKTYYELGNALLEVKTNVDKALQAYEVAEHLQFQPLGNVYYGKAIAYAMQEKDDPAAYYILREAFEKGFSDTLKMYREKRLKLVVNSKDFRKFMREQKLHRLATNQPDRMFDVFRSSFAQVQQPFEIPVEKVDMKAYDQSVSYDFVRFIPEMQNTSFSREVSHDFFFVARVAETPEYTALIYSSVSFYEENMQPVLTKLVTFNNQGKVISSLVFACQCSAEKIKKGKIENNLITLEDYRRYWKKPIDKVDFEENSVEKYELLSTATYRIDEQGKIVEESVPAGYKENQQTIASK